MTSMIILKTQHTSLEHSDNPRQQEHDISLLFARGRGFPVKTGTEAGVDETGRNRNRELLQTHAHLNDHHIHFARDNWIAVDRSIVKRGSLTAGSVFIADNDEMVGHGQDRVMATMSWDHVDDRVGHISQGAVHYAVKGAAPGDPNYDLNERYAKQIQKWLHDVAEGRALAFVNGDFNMPDNRTDWAFDGKFTSLADELKAWQGTGHGPIDGMCSCDRDGRVHADWFRVLDDHERFLFSDHWMCRGAWAIEALRRP